MLDKYQHNYLKKISQAAYFIYRMSKKNTTKTSLTDSPSNSSQNHDVRFLRI